MNLKFLRQRDAELRAEVAKATSDRAALGTAAVTEKRLMTDEERTKFAALGTQVDALNAQLAENAELLSAAEAANEAARNYRGPVASESATPHIETIADEADKKAKGEPGYFGRQLQAVRRAAYAMKEGVTLSVADNTLLGPMRAASGSAASGANTDVPSEGGFLVVPERSGSVVQRMYDQGEIMSRVTRQPIGANSNGMTFPAIDETSRADGSRYGGIASSWVGQATTATAGKPKFRLMELKLRKILAFVYQTEEMKSDAVALEGWINRYLPLELTFRAEDAVVNGIGSNQPLGLLNSGAAITVTRNTASKVLYEDVSGMWARMFAPLRNNAVWIIDQSVEQQLEQMSIAIGTAGVLAPIYKPAGTSFSVNGTQGYLGATIYGRPVLVTEYGATLGTVGDIILTNLGEYTVIDKGGVRQDVSLHVAFLTDEEVYRFSYRVDGQLNWNSALTPKSGGSTLSSVVTLT